MIVGICDYPSAYEFPPHGYGSIERWLWAVAVGAQEWGATVYLLGPQWRTDLPPIFRRQDARLEEMRAPDRRLDELAGLGLDLIVAGHEYPALPAWRQTAERLGCAIVTFQHDPRFIHPTGTFDASRTRLYCYSDEMAQLYRVHHPRRELSVQIGTDEEPLPASEGDHLVWLGRICADKAPHLAARVAAQLGRRLRLIGPVHDREYVFQHATDFGTAEVEWVGELGGVEKSKALSQAGTLVYTCAPGYIEAGAAVFGDALRAGTPVAALAWRPGTCSEAALCHDTGAVAVVPPGSGEAAAVEALCAAVAGADRMDPGTVQQVGLRRFDPIRHFETLAALR